MPRKVVGKRGSAGTEMIMCPKDDDKTIRFEVDTSEGPPPEELLQVVPDEVAETVSNVRMEYPLRPSEASLELDAMDAKACMAWGWTPRSAVMTGTETS